MSLPVINNTTARALFLDRHELSRPRSQDGRGAALSALIHRLGFVQVDSVNTLARAHDMILFSRCGNYRPASLRWLNDRSRDVFENWTHDASAIPVQFFPYWRLKFARDAVRLRRVYKNWHGPEFQGELDTVRTHIAAHGASCSRNLGEAPAGKSTGWWDWKPSKTALEYLWRSGELSVCHRAGFAKFYDLTERVIPPEYLNTYFADDAVVDWAAQAALDRLGFATSGELAAFFDLISAQEAKDWVSRALAMGVVQEAEVEGADGRVRRCVLRPETLTGLCELAPPAPRLRLLSPFDPALRDRKRAEWLFGFHYRIEIFVPAAKRQYGYYVFPILEGDRLVGRVDVQADRQMSELQARALWPEHDVRFGRGRMDRLMAELDRAARFSGCDKVKIAPDFLRLG